VVASLAVTLTVGITCGLLTAVYVARSGLTETLACRSPARVLDGTSRGHWRQAAVICEVAIAVVIVVAAVVAAAEVRRLQQADPGFTDRNVVVARIGVTVARLKEIYRTLPGRLPKNQQVFYANQNPPVLKGALSDVVFAEDLLGLVHPIPGVTLAAVAGTVPLAETPLTTLVSLPESPTGPTADSRADVLPTYLVQATEDYFRVLKMPLHSGRFFSELDRMAGEPVAIVSQTLARRLWGEQAAVGQRLRQEGEELPVKVVGVVGDVALSRPGDPPTPMIYRPLAQSPPRWTRLLINANTTAEQLRPALSEATHRVGAHLFDMRELSDIVDRSMVPAGSAARALAMLASMAVVLAFVGLYASFAATLQFRQRELGIRMAIGASPAKVSLLVLRYPLTLTVAGTALGLVTVFVIARTLAAWVPIPPVSLTAIVVTILLVLGAAALASVRPLIRARRLDPAMLIR
jgi:putative ABC transport system permease protein